MSEKHKKLMGDMARDHGTCKRLCGVFRPGKTAKDRASKGY